jgi:hypothetical protein
MNIFKLQDTFKLVQGREKTEENPPMESMMDAGKAEDFSSFIRGALEGYGKEMVSEEDLFAVLIEQRLGEVSEEAAEMYATEREKEINSIRRGDGYVNMEKAAVRALRTVVDSGMIDKEEGERVYGEAFMGAQLDDNLDELWDDRGSANDPTIAIASIEEALMKAGMFMEQLQSGAIEVAQRNLSIGSTGEATAAAASASNHTGHTAGSNLESAAGNRNVQAQSLDGPGGFLWKPVSESDNKLVVLLPEALRGAISRVEIHTSLPPSDITKLAEGRFAGDTMNGNRPHFRFDKPGSGYGSDVHLVAYKDDGSVLSWDIKDGGSRHE